VEINTEDIKTNRHGVSPKARFAEVLPSHAKPKLLNKMTRMLIGGKEAETEQKIVPYNGVPPPSDYFLGFSSPGTQVRNEKHALLFLDINDSNYVLKSHASSVVFERFGAGYVKLVSKHSVYMRSIQEK
jgi:hypothetical protein